MKLFAKISAPVLAGLAILISIILLKTPDASNQIEIKYSYISQTVNTEFNLVDACGITFHFAEEPQPYYTSSDSDILEIDSNSADAKCLKQGVAIVTILLNSEIGICQKEITVVVDKETIYSEYAYFDYPEIIVYSDQASTNKFYFDPNSSFTPTASYKNNTASYNYLTGKVTATADDTVYLTLPKNEEEFFLVKFEIKVETRQIVSMERTVSLNDTAKIDYQSQLQSSPENSAFSLASNSNQDCVSIISQDYGYLIVQANQLGQSLITIINEKYIIKILITVE